MRETFMGRSVQHNSPAKPVSKAKAGEILRHGEAHGKPLTEKQSGLFGLIRGGGAPTKAKGYKG